MVQEIILRFLDDVVAVYEEEKVSVALFIEIKHQPGHNERFATAGGHIIKQMNGPILFAVEIGVPEIIESSKGFSLIFADRKFRRKVVLYIVETLICDRSELGERIKLFVEKIHSRKEVLLRHLSDLIEIFGYLLFFLRAGKVFVVYG